MVVEKQERFVRLIAQGVTNAEACRIVGINRRTGTRWRYGRTILNTAGEPVHYPAVSFIAAKPRHPRYLSLAEQTMVADLRRAGVSMRGIAEQLGRAASTVSRELRRNADDQGRYLPATAERLTVERQSRPSRTRRLARDEQLHRVVAELLGKRWSPEQIAHELPMRFPGQPERHLCTESIYQAIYEPRIALTRPAKRRRRRRRRRVQGLERRGRLTAMTMIADRPTEVEDRVQVGHWEGDCIMGAGNRSAIGTLVERVTRFLILVHVPTGRPTAEAVRDGVTDVLGALAPHLRRTLTWDQGKELSLHQQITARTGTRVFFCDAHSPWQRGSNENMNGLLRDYFPKGTDLANISPQELQRVADEINDRPRKTLGWARPADLITDAVSVRTA
jgi:IS30 family transposase